MHTMFPTIPQDSPDYLGRLVISYSRVYTVVRTRQRYDILELFIASQKCAAKPNLSMVSFKRMWMTIRKTS